MKFLPEMKMAAQYDADVTRRTLALLYRKDKFEICRYDTRRHVGKDFVIGVFRPTKKTKSKKS